MNKNRTFILQISLLTGLAVYLLVALTYSRRQADKLLCNRLEVNIANSNDNRLLTRHDVEAIFKDNNLNYFGKTVNDLPLSKMERTLNQNHLVRQANVYAGIDGILHVNIAQREPILRVYTGSNRSFYVDNTGYIIYLNEGRPAYVPVVNGDVNIPFRKGFEGNLLDVLSPRKEPNHPFLQLFYFGRYIHNHPFWSAQIEQIYFAPNHKVELVPRVGAHIIQLGSLDNYEYKLNKLATLYRKGLPAKGWNEYHTIDLSYSNQIICHKK